MAAGNEKPFATVKVRVLQEKMAGYKHPRAIEFVDLLPKTQSGKTRRKLLREKEEAKRSA